jgi:hypothetical protein
MFSIDAHWHSASALFSIKSPNVCMDNLWQFAIRMSARTMRFRTARSGFLWILISTARGLCETFTYKDISSQSADTHFVRAYETWSFLEINRPTTHEALFSVTYIDSLNV